MKHVWQRIIIGIFVSVFLSSPFGWANETTDSSMEIGSYLFGGLRARSIGPAVMGGRIAALDVVNDDPRIIYVGAASGGVWKSLNGGVTFTPIFDKYTQSIGAIAIDQKHPDTVWIGTGEPWVRNSVSVGTGIYKTTDGGESWTCMGLKDSEHIGKIVIDPRNSNTVYVAVLGHLWNANKERGLYKTTDGGKTWERILYVDENTGCADLAIDPQEPDIVYAAMWQFRRLPYHFTSGGPGSGLYKSTDGGKTWKRLENGLPEGELGRIAVAVAPSRPNIVYAFVESKETALYRSDDLGETFIKMNDMELLQIRPFYFSLLVVDPKDYKRVYKPGTVLNYSKDGGKTFGTSFSGGVHPDLHALWIDPNAPSHMLVGTDGGIYESFNYGNSWRFLNNLPVSQFYHVSCDTQKPYYVYGGLQDNGSWMGPSESPNGIGNKDWENIGAGDGIYVLVDPLDNDILYYDYQGGNVRRYHRTTHETKDITPFPDEDEPEYRFNWNTPIVLSPNNPKKLYLGAQFLFQSTDQGESWQKLSGDLTTDDPEKQRQKESGGLTIDNSTAENHCTIYTISESPLDSNIIWVGTDDGNVQITTDGGKSWENVVKHIKGLPPCTWCSCIEASRHSRTTAYATFDGHRTGDMKTYIYRTTDLGKTWEPLATDSVRGYAYVIREDLVNPNLLFVGTEFGLFISLDGGKHWAQFKENLPNVSVRDIALQAEESDLVLATHGRGIYIIDDITPLRHITPEVLASDLFIFPSAPTTITMPIFHQEFPGDDEFDGENPDDAAQITYYLKKRHMMGSFNIEIRNADGTLMKTLPAGKRRGINRVAWHMRMKPPKVAKSTALAPYALFGPAAPEGTYSVYLIKNEDTVTSTLELIPDPSLPYTAEERAFRREVVMKLYDMQEELAYVAAVISDMKDQALQRKDEIKKSSKLKKELTTFADKLDSLYATIAITKKQGMMKTILSGEKKLREKVVELYGAVITYGGKPTQSQLKRMTVLEREIEKAQDRFTALTEKELNKLNKKLSKAKLAPLTLLTREEFDKREQ